MTPKIPTRRKGSNLNLFPFPLSSFHLSAPAWSSAPPSTALCTHKKDDIPREADLPLFDSTRDFLLVKLSIIFLRLFSGPDRRVKQRAEDEIVLLALESVFHEIFLEFNDYWGGNTTHTGLSSAAFIDLAVCCSLLCFTLFIYGKVKRHRVRKSCFR